MTTRRPHRAAARISASSTWLKQPLSASWCALGWLVATALFVSLTRILGGITTGDAADSVNTTWALAHGVASCAYAPGNQFGLPYSAPLYPLLSAGLAALLRIGHSVSFPTQTMMGPHCSTAIAAMYHWSLRSHALLTTVQLGYAGWIVLMAGVVALLRVSGRGRCGWEPVTLILVACVPSVSMCLSEYFHPQDLVAMGLILVSLACAIRGRWLWAGALLGLGFTSQQFALLVLVPLLVVAPRNHRAGFVAAAIGSASAIVVPLIPLTSEGVLKAALLGSGSSSVTNTLLGSLNLQSPLLQFALSRLMPLVCAMALARWAMRKFGSLVLEPVPLISLIATSLSFRLVFETNLWGYYFMAVAVLLVILDVIRGRFRMLLVVWLSLLALAFYPVSNKGDVFSQAMPFLLPLWSWQIILVSTSIALALGPLTSFTCYQSTRSSEDER